MSNKDLESSGFLGDDMPEANRVPADIKLLKDTIEVVEAWLAEQKKILPPDKKAEVVT